MEILTPKLYRVMDDLGFAESTIGTRYIRRAVEICAEQPRAMMTKDVYPQIAKEFGAAPHNVERAIRVAITKARRSPSWEWRWGMVTTQEPTNSEVVFRLLRDCANED